MNHNDDKLTVQIRLQLWEGVYRHNKIDYEVMATILEYEDLKFIIRNWMDSITHTWQFIPKNKE